MLQIVISAKPVDHIIQTDSGRISSTVAVRTLSTQNLLCNFLFNSHSVIRHFNTDLSIISIDRNLYSAFAFHLTNPMIHRVFNQRLQDHTRHDRIQ